MQSACAGCWPSPPARALPATPQKLEGRLQRGALAVLCSVPGGARRSPGPPCEPRPLRQRHATPSAAGATWATDMGHGPLLEP